MARYRVAPGTQVNRQGTVYGPGETVEAEAEEVAVEVAAGWLVPAKPNRAAKAAHDG